MVDQIQSSQEIIAHELSFYTQKSLESIFGQDIQIFSEEKSFTKRFDRKGELISLIDFSGSVIGYFAIGCNEKTALTLLQSKGEKLSNHETQDFGEMLNEVINTIGGNLLPNLKKTYPLVTLTSPRWHVGSLQYPPNPCLQISLKTNFGEFFLCYGTDSMGLDVIDLLDTVQAQQSELKEIADHIDLILLKLNQQGMVDPGYSKISESLLNTKKLEGTCFFDFIETSYDAQCRDEFEKWIECLFSANKSVQWEKLMKLCPIEQIQHDGRIIKLRFTPISVNGHLSKVLAIGKDVTEVVKLEHQIQQELETHDEQLTIMKSLLTPSRHEITVFLHQCAQNIEKLKTIVFEEEGELMQAKSLTHMIKGDAGLLDFHPLASTAQQCELDMGKALDTDQSLITNEHKVDMKTSMSKLDKDFQKIFHWAKKLNLVQNTDTPLERQIETSEKTLKSHLIALKNVEEQVNDSNILQKVIDDLEKHLNSPSKYFESKLQKMITQANIYDKKKLAPLQVVGKDVTLPLNFWEQVLPLLAHLLRNAVAHGIEPHHLRKQSSKEIQGSISVSFRLDSELHISVKDDGAGINPDTIYKKYLSLGFKANPTFSNQDKINLVMLPELSTRKGNDGISGAGVGLWVVKDKMESLGGALTITSKPLKETTFHLRFPLESLSI